MNIAASKIQAAYRGMKAKEQVKQENLAASKIQAAYRGMKARSVYRLKQAEEAQRRAVDRENALSTKPYLAEVEKFDRLTLNSSEEGTDQYDQMVSAYIGDISMALANSRRVADDHIDEQMCHLMADHVDHEALSSLKQYKELNDLYVTVRDMAAAMRKADLGARLSKSNRPRISKLAASRPRMEKLCYAPKSCSATRPS